MAHVKDVMLVKSSQSLIKGSLNSLKVDDPIKRERDYIKPAVVFTTKLDCYLKSLELKIIPGWEKNPRRHSHNCLCNNKSLLKYPHQKIY
jgi:hypothetical protein